MGSKRIEPGNRVVLRVREGGWKCLGQVGSMSCEARVPGGLSDMSK